MINTYTVNGPTTAIACENNSEIYYCIIDTEDLEKCKKAYKWNILRGYKGCLRVQGRVDGIPVLMHRYLMKIESYYTAVSHANHDGLNNKRDNLVTKPIKRQHREVTV